MLLEQATEDTGRITPSILIISKRDKCLKNQTPFQTFAADN